MKKTMANTGNSGKWAHWQPIQNCVCVKVSVVDIGLSRDNVEEISETFFWLWHSSVFALCSFAVSQFFPQFLSVFCSSLLYFTPVFLLGVRLVFFSRVSHCLYGGVCAWLSMFLPLMSDHQRFVSSFAPGFLSTLLLIHCFSLPPWAIVFVHTDAVVFVHTRNQISTPALTVWRWANFTYQAVDTSINQNETYIQIVHPPV